MIFQISSHISESEKDNIFELFRDTKSEKSKNILIKGICMSRAFQFTSLAWFRKMHFYTTSLNNVQHFLSDQYYRLS